VQIISTNAEVKLVDKVKDLKGDLGTNYGLHFHLSQLQEEFKSEFQLKIAMNILNDIFRNSEGGIYLCRDGDIVLVYQGTDRNLIEKAIFQLRYLFVEDPLANHEDGTENEAFSSLFDLAFQWQPFHKSCSDKMTSVLRKETVAVGKGGKQDPKLFRQPLNANNLQKVMEMIEQVDIAHALRMQPICAQPKGRAMSAVFDEVYIHISHLSYLLADRYDLAADRTLFKYLTRQLDRYVLRLLMMDPGRYIKRPLSININTETLLSPQFLEFCERMTNTKSSLVFEIQVADVLTDLRSFRAARDIVQKHNYRVCVDGLNTLNFQQIDPKTLGFDLVKIQWNADVAGDLNTPENQKLREAVERAGANRIILCWCDSSHAIDYGHVLGISLFQGRYPDRVVNPNSSLEN
jgi:EAL domain-containing protein (putative c-di-GMP-specific phosphodiesterase class I)